MKKEQLEKNLDRISEWIRSSDQKVSIFLAFQGLILVQLFPFLYHVIIEHNSHYLYSFILFILGVSYLLLSVLISGFSIISKLENKHKKSLIYFKDISFMKIEIYKEKVKSCTDEQYEDSLMEQIHILSGIATKKNQQSTESATVFVFGIIILLVFLLIK